MAMGVVTGCAALADFLKWGSGGSGIRLSSFAGVAPAGDATGRGRCSVVITNPPARDFGRHRRLGRRIRRGGLLRLGRLDRLCRLGGLDPLGLAPEAPE